MSGARGNFRYYNREGAWLDFSWSGLETLPDGSLRLISLPLVSPSVDLPLVPRPDLAGIAVAPDGSVFVTTPGGGRVLFLSHCGGDPVQVPLEVQLSRPTGIAVSSAHGMIFVSDANTGVIHAFDWTTWTERLRWYGFTRPVALAAAEGGVLYVCDPAAGRVDQLTATGDRTSFGDAASPHLTSPEAVALDGGLVYVLDGAGAVAIFDEDGEFNGYAAEGLASPRGLACIGGSVYVSDLASGTVHVFRKVAAGWVECGAAQGFRAPLAAVASNPAGALVIHTGDPRHLVAMSVEGAYTREGLLWSATLDASLRTVAWRRLELIGEVPAGTRVELVYHLDLEDRPPAVQPGSPEPFPDPWTSPGPDLSDLYLGDQQAKYLWVGARILGDGTATPVLRQVRAEFDHPGYIEQLPAIYREDADAGFLTRLLSLLEGEFQDVERQFELLHVLLHPYAVDAARLEWLARFLALELPPELSAAKRRDLVATAYVRSARSGTPAAILEAIHLETGVTAAIVEPVQQVGWWSLAADEGCPPQPAVFGGLLGLDTVLGACEPQGAVVGVTATLDRSHLLTAEEYGAPMFDEAAHQFSVYVYARDAACERTMKRVRQVVEREKPAHTLAQLCVIPAKMRIGYQATLGIDSVVAAPPEGSRLGDPQLLLSGPPAGHISSDARVGVSTRL